MGKMRCFLCGGRVANGVCTECGMPQQRHETNHDLNKNDCDGKTLPHVHEDKPQTAVRANASEQPQKRQERSYFVRNTPLSFTYMSRRSLQKDIKKNGHSDSEACVCALS